MSDDLPPHLEEVMSIDDFVVMLKGLAVSTESDVKLMIIKNPSDDFLDFLARYQHAASNKKMDPLDILRILFPNRAQPSFSTNGPIHNEEVQTQKETRKDFSISLIPRNTTSNSSVDSDESVVPIVAQLELLKPDTPQPIRSDFNPFSKMLLRRLDLFDLFPGITYYETPLSTEEQSALMKERDDEKELNDSP